MWVWTPCRFFVDSRASVLCCCCMGLKCSRTDSCLFYGMVCVLFGRTLERLPPHTIYSIYLPTRMNYLLYDQLIGRGRRKRRCCCFQGLGVCMSHTSNIGISTVRYTTQYLYFIALQPLLHSHVYVLHRTVLRACKVGSFLNPPNRANKEVIFI